MKQYILFDLDGTLTDPKVGITTCVQYALKDFGIDEPDLDKLEPFIGPPLKDSFINFYNLTDEQGEKAVAKYRERFQDTGIFENELYPGVHDLLRTLKAGGMHLAVASSKPTVYVERILKRFKLDKYFEVVVGSELSGERVEKPQVLQEVLHRFFPDRQPKYDEIYMVGDRKFDMEGARTFRIESIGVTYGYGSMEELKEARADYIVSSVAELKKLLMREIEAIRRKEAETGKVTASGKPAKPQGTKMIWKMVLPFIMFYLMKTTVSSMVSLALQAICLQTPLLERLLTAKDEAAGTVYLNGNAYAISQTAGFLAAAMIIWKFARSAINKTAEETKLSHLKREPARNYVILAVTTLGAVLGANMFITLSGLTEVDEVYQATRQMQHSSSIWLGLVCYGLAAPVAEELIFRGIIYNCLRRFAKLKMAMFLSAFFFGIYHSNPAQTIYAFVMGLLMAYAYEYFGYFYVPLGIHMGANIVVYLMAKAGADGASFANAAVAVVVSVIALAGFFLLEKDKKLLKNVSVS